MMTTRMIGAEYATACSGRTKAGLPCKRNTYVLVNGDPFCSVHEGQAKECEVETLPGQWVCPTCGGTFIADQIERHQEWHEWI